MIVKPADIDRNGQLFIMELSADPTKLDTQMGSLYVGYAGADQVFIPGISIPGIDIPFHVPVIGDNESLSLVVDRPQKLEAPHIERVTFVGMLIAESVRIKLPTEDDSAHVFEEDPEAFELDEAFTDYTGEWGGFLRAVAELRYIDLDKGNSQELTGCAELYIIEDEAEWQIIDKLLLTGRASAQEIVTLKRLGSLAALSTAY